jgi:hypothetical protein
VVGSLGTHSKFSFNVPGTADPPFWGSGYVHACPFLPPDWQSLGVLHRMAQVDDGFKASKDMLVQHAVNKSIDNIFFINNSN